MEHNETFTDFVKRKKQQFFQVKNNLRIIFVSSLNKETGNNYKSIDQTTNELLGLCKKYDIDYHYFSKENAFIEAVCKEEISISPYTFIYNQSFSGPLFSRRILIPAFCGFNHLPYMGNDAYRMGLLCDKFHYYSILKNIGVPIADFWYYHYAFGWLTEKPVEGLKVIMKLSNENNKISLSRESVFPYSDDYEEAIHSLSLTYKQGVILQKFIIGYEITVPVIIDKNTSYIPNILGIRYGDEIRHGEQFFTEEIFSNVSHMNYENKYYDFDSVNSSLKKTIIDYSEKIVQALGIRWFTRIDLRVDDSWGIYFNDIGSMPSIMPTGAFACIYQMNNLSYEDFLITTICIDWQKT